MVVILWPHFFFVKIGYRYEYQSTFLDFTLVYNMEDYKGKLKNHCPG